MGTKVDMTEVHNMKKAVESSLKSVDSNVDQLSSSMSKLINTDGFEGKAASSVKNYTNTFHIKSINKIKKINRDFKSDLDKSINKFESEVDNNQAAILDESKIKEYKKEIVDALRDAFKSSDDANNAINDVSDLSTAKKIKYDNLSNKMADFNKHIDKTLEKLTSFDANNSIDGDRTDNLITELSGLSSYVKGLSSNRARISSTTKKIEKAIARHQTSQELIKWQKYLEKTSDTIYKKPFNKNAYDAMVQAGREYFALKAIGNGSAMKGFKKYNNTRDINKLINNMDKKQLRKMAMVFNKNRDNIKLKNAIKNTGEFVKNNPFKKGNLVNWMSKVQEYDNKTAEILKKDLKNKNFQYKFGDAKKFFDAKEMKKAASTEFKNTFSNQSFRETFLKKENLKSKSAIQKNIKKYWNEDIKGVAKDFKNKNILGKLGKLTKMGGKALKPLAAITAITDNMSKDSLQEKLVGAGVDLSILGGSAAAGAAVGTAIPIPVVGTLAGAGVGILAGMLGDIKVEDKAVKDIAKDKINNSIDNSKKIAKNSWNTVTKGVSSVFS
ncbi:T7SS effector LXG polymorphic toxin [Staphylococcus epidermidis]|uniref:T7SS effector LXG polymorphic toxin n=1 Tax=Staphylococcus epidermidis TaxID=1282 RepID=UPI00119CE1BC|nr:T7SS effector LXG polymorphic toxin [Staphylococcus epidermidis]